MHDCHLSFRYEETDNSYLPNCVEFQVQIEGLLLAGSSLVEMQDHWRIDRTALDAQSAFRESHPALHFQRGGRAQDDFVAMDGFVPADRTDLGAGTWRTLMQYTGPRIASLPFDPLLAIDFCPAQNNGVVWRRLRNMPEYSSIIEDALRRLCCLF